MYLAELTKGQDQWRRAPWRAHTAKRTAKSQIGIKCPVTTSPPLWLWR